MHFSYDLEATLTDAERQADLKLTAMKAKLVNPEFNVVIRDFYDNRKLVEESQLYQALDKMPKGALHHIHTSAAPPIETYMQLTYDPCVFYNERERIFKIFPIADVQREDGYVSCVTMRNFSKDPAKFDSYLRNQILLTREQTEGKASHDIWKNF
jgi:hypothetical protein